MFKIDVRSDNSAINRLILINACIRIGNIPIDWKSGQLTPILKKGQDQDDMDKSCYRPVSF